MTFNAGMMKACLADLHFERPDLLNINPISADRSMIQNIQYKVKNYPSSVRTLRAPFLAHPS